MAQNIFNPMELDAIGEIMNISLGSSATAVSNMLDHRVDITTPSVDVVSVDDFSIGDLEPAIGIEIRYVSGLEGSNTPYVVIEDRVEAIHWAMDHAQPGDVIALCGKGHETYQEVNHEKHHMDEREIVAEHLTGK